MKRLIALVLSLWVGVAQSQMTLACQFRQGGGLAWTKGEWQLSGFIFKRPFFLTIRSDKTIEPKSALIALGTSEKLAQKLQDDQNYIYCFPHNTDQLTMDSSCARSGGSLIIVSLKTFEGAVTRALGAASDAIRDDISVVPFVCQRM